MGSISSSACGRLGSLRVSEAATWDVNSNQILLVANDSPALQKLAPTIEKSRLPRQISHFRSTYHCFGAHKFRKLVSNAWLPILGFDFDAQVRPQDVWLPWESSLLCQGEISREECRAEKERNGTDSESVQPRFFSLGGSEEIDRASGPVVFEG